MAVSCLALSMIGIYELKPQVNILLQITSGLTIYNWRACSQARFGTSEVKFIEFIESQGILI